MRQSCLTLIVVVVSSGGFENEQKALDAVTTADAAAHLLARFDVCGPEGPAVDPKPDGEWHYQELAQYVNASRRPEGEPLNVTASNLMFMIDTDRNNSITRTELEAFLESRRDSKGLNGEAGLRRAAKREADLKQELEESKKKYTTADGKTFITSEGGPDVEQLSKMAQQREQTPKKAKGRRRRRSPRASASKAKDEV
mmetsp:Transcript_18790/g.47997  ORF Transcript_18790/g.47997 Transcript_18790/m.47997 type:complete len:198 (-) Transcript_18790:249-842(-)